MGSPAEQWRSRAVGARFSAINNTRGRDRLIGSPGSAPVGAHDSLYSSSSRAAAAADAAAAPPPSQLPPERGHEINFSPCTSHVRAFPERDPY